MCIWFEYFSRGRVSGVFEPDAITRLQQGMTDQLHGLTISRGHEHLRWRAVDPTRNLEIPGDFRTQQRQAVHRRMDHVRRLHGAHTARAKARPDLPGKRIQGRQTHLERQDGIRTKTDGVHAVIRQRHRARNGRSRLEVRAYNGPCLPARLDIPLGGQQGISRFDGASGQPQFLGQRPCRGNAVTRLQHSTGDSVAKPIVNLPVERCGRRRIKRRDFFGLCGRHGLIRSVDERKPTMP